MTKPEAITAFALQRSPIHEQILPHLRQQIIENRLKPGERLREPVLCKEFGISRTPLRQALKVLETEGLVVLVPHVGAVVTDPDDSAVAENMEILIGVEQLAAIRLAERQPATVIARIQTIYADMEEAARNGNSTLYFGLNDSFHQTIVKGTGNPGVIALHEQTMSHIHRERRRVNQAEPFSVEAAEHHRPIVELITQGKPTAAGEAMRQHLDDVTKLILARRARR